MKSNKFLKGSILIALIASAFWVGTAFAAGCFTDTNGHPYETAICWLKANGIVGGTTFRPDNAATRATVAQWLFKQSQIPPTTGSILITPGNSEWVPFYNTSNTTISYYSNLTRFEKLATGDEHFTIQPSIPTALYGRSLKLLGVEFCYTASVDVFLSYVEINTFTSTTGGGTRTLQFSDATDRTDAACRYYVLPTPVTLTASDGVNFYVGVHWNVSNSNFDAARTTFVLQATGTKVTPPSADSADTVILTESSASSEEFNTTAP